MPPRQQHVARLILERSHGKTTANMIQKLLQEGTKEFVSRGMVNRAQQEAKRKLRVVLRRFKKDAR